MTISGAVTFPMLRSSAIMTGFLMGGLTSDTSHVTSLMLAV